MAGGGIGDIASTASGLIGSLTGDAGGAYDAMIKAAEQAADLAKSYGTQSLSYLKDYTTQANQQLERYNNLTQAMGQPVTAAGLNALDALQRSVGVGVAPGGSFNLQQALIQEAKDKYTNEQNKQRWMHANDPAMSSLAYQIAQAAPGIWHGAGQPGVNDSVQILMKFLRQNGIDPAQLTADPYQVYTNQMAGPLAGEYGNTAYGERRFGLDATPAIGALGNIKGEAPYSSYPHLPAGQSGIPGVPSSINELLGQAKDLMALYLNPQNYDPSLALVNNLSEENRGIVDQFNKGTLYNNISDADRAAQRELGIREFIDSPFMQMTFKGYDPTVSVGENFMKDPTFQMIYKDIANGINRGAAAKGYADSPRLQQEIMQSLAGDILPGYVGQLQNNFQNYQNTLTNIAGMGTTQNLASQGNMMQTGQGVSSNLYNLGTNSAQINQQTASDVISAALARGQAQAQQGMARYNQGQSTFGNVASASGNAKSSLGSIFGK